MPSCLRCGRLYHARDKSGMCDSCSTVFGSGQVHLPDTKKVTRGRYQQEVEKASSAKLPKLKMDGGLSFGLSSLIILFLWVVGSVLAYRFLGFSPHSVIWSVSVIFFAIGLFMVINRRISRGKLDSKQLSSSVDPRTIHFLPYIMGALWMLPLIMCALYYSLSASLPDDRALWFIGSAAGFALLVELVCVLIFSRSKTD
jgi:hypothetical protein